jgi:uncharacterized RDD family membrane protein YckC
MAGVVPAPLGRRAAAYILDWLVSLSGGLVLVGGTAAILLLTSDLDRHDPPDWSLYLSLVILLSWIPIWFLATTLLWFLWGASIGMLCTGICVIRPSGELPGLRQSAGRALLLALMSGPALAAPLLGATALAIKIDRPGYLELLALTLISISLVSCASVTFRRDGRGWHDLISGTAVAVAGRH